MNKKTNFARKFGEAQICSTDPDDGDIGDSGGGGGDGAVVDSSPPSLERDGGGGTSDRDANHTFNSRGYNTPEQGKQVSEILKKGDDYRLTFSELDLLLGFEGVKPDDKDTKKQEPAKAQPPKSGAQSLPPALGAPAPEANKSPELDPNVKALTERIDQLVQTAVRPQPETGEPKQPAKPKMFYGDVQPAFNVNPELMRDLMDPDDPQKNITAINSIVNGLANKLMQDQILILSRAMQNLQQYVPQAVQTHTNGRELMNKFYTTYKELNAPGIQPLVVAVAKQMIEQNKGASVDEKFLDQLGKNVHAAFKAQFGFDLPRQGAPAVPSNGNMNGVQPQKKKKTFVTSGGARPPAAPGGSQSADILDFIM